MQSGGEEKRSGVSISLRKSSSAELSPNVAESPLLLFELRLRLPAFWVASCVHTFHTCMQLPTTQTSFLDIRQERRAYPGLGLGEAKHVRGQEAAGASGRAGGGRGEGGDGGWVDRASWRREGGVSLEGVSLTERLGRAGPPFSFEGMLEGNSSKSTGSEIFDI